LRAGYRTSDSGEDLKAILALDYVLASRETQPTCATVGRRVGCAVNLMADCRPSPPSARIGAKKRKADAPAQASEETATGSEAGPEQDLPPKASKRIQTGPSVVGEEGGGREEVRQPSYFRFCIKETGWSRVS